MDTATRHCTFPALWKTPAGSRSQSAKTPRSCETPAMRKYDLIIVNADRRDDEFKFTPASKRRSSTSSVPDTAMSRSTAPTTPPRTGCPPGKKCSAAFSRTSACPTARPRKGSFTVKIADTSQPDHAGTEGLQAHGRAVLPDADDARRPAAGDDRISRRRLAGRLDADTSARAASSTPCSATATSAPKKTTRCATPTWAAWSFRESTGSPPAAADSLANREPRRARVRIHEPASERPIDHGPTSSRNCRRSANRAERSWPQPAARL